MASTPGRPGPSSSDMWAGTRAASGSGSSVFGGQGAKNRPGGSSGSSNGIGLDSTPSSSRTTGFHGGAAVSTPPAHGRAASAAMRSRKSALPDIGTPIKVASSSPYRTPESTSKASILLSRTPFGTPAKAQAGTSTSSGFGTPANGSAASQLASSQRPGSLGSGTGAPVKPVTSKRAHIVALSRSLYDGGAAHVSTALQARPFLPYSSLVKVALRANWFRLGVIVLTAHHILACIALGSPAHPFYSISLFLRPMAILLSMVSFGMLGAVLSLTSSHPLSILKPQWAEPAKMHVQDVRVGSSTLPASSPASIAASRLIKATTWRSIMLHAAFGTCLGIANVAGLLYFGDSSSHWLPYTSVPIRLSSGQRSYALRPNERFFYLIAANAAICAIFAIHRSVQSASPLLAAATPLQEPAFESQASFNTPYGRIARRLRREGYFAAILGLLAPLAILQIYLIIRRPLFRLILSIIGHHSPFRPLIVPSFRKPLLNAELSVRTELLGLASILLLVIFNVAWEVCATQPVDSISTGVSRFAREPTRALIRGMQLRRSNTAEEGAASLSAVERDYLAHFAFSEMAVVASTDVERRKAIFRDVAGTAGTHSISASQNGGVKTASAWAQIATECLAVLKEEQQWIDNRGKAPAPAPAANASQATLNAKSKPVDDAHKIDVGSGSDVIKPRPANIWDKLASSAGGAAPPSRPAAMTPSASATASSTSTEQGSGGLGSLLHRIAPPAPRPAAPGSQTTGAVRSGAPNATSANATAGARPQQPTTPTKLAVDLVFSLVQGVWGVFARVFGALPSDVQHVLTKSGPSRWLFSGVHAFFGQSQDKQTATAVLVQSGVLPHDAALATWSVQTLSALLAASLDQDEYGTVALSAASQHCGLDDVLEAFAGLLLSLQGLASDLQGDGGLAMRGASAATFDEVAGPLLVALRTGITLVVGVFEPTGVILRPTCRQLIDKALQASGKQSNSPEMAERGK